MSSFQNFANTFHCRQPIIMTRGLLCLTRMPVCKLLKNGGQGRNRTADASLFSLSASCICNDLTGLRWLLKCLISRDRRSNRGLESWAEKVTRDGFLDFASTAVTALQ